MDNIYYINRLTEKKEQEQVPAGGTIRFFYNNPIGKAGLNILFKRKVISALGGWLFNTKFSKKKITRFVAEHNIDLAEYEEKSYTHFNDFFYRKIKAKNRPIQNGVVSPADGKILVFPTIKDVDSFFIKGSEFCLQDFLADKDLTQKYANGSMAIIRLAPTDYHRFHFPADGEISETKLIKGVYYSVSPLALKQSLEIFCQNKRTISILKSDAYNDILISEVGATMVGSILQTYNPNTQVKKGDEKGYFAFGGSTLVLLFEEGKIAFSQDLIQNTKNGLETTVKMGQTIGE